MKRIAVFFLILASACASLGVPTPTTYNERLAAAYSTATTLVQTTNTLLVAKKITAQDAQNTLNQIDAAKAALDVSSVAFKTDTAAGNSKLAATITVLTALQSYLALKGK